MQVVKQESNFQLEKHNEMAQSWIVFCENFKRFFFRMTLLATAFNKTYLQHI